MMSDGVDPLTGPLISSRPAGLPPLPPMICMVELKVTSPPRFVVFERTMCALGPFMCTTTAPLKITVSTAVVVSKMGPAFAATPISAPDPDIVTDTAPSIVAASTINWSGVEFGFPPLFTVKVLSKCASRT